MYVLRYENGQRGHTRPGAARCAFQTFEAADKARERLLRHNPALVVARVASN